MRTRALVTLAVLASSTLPVFAQVPTLARGPELAKLEALTGTWRGRVERVLPNGDRLIIEPIATIDWDVGGVWLRSDEITELPDGTIIDNRTEITWNRAAAAYVGAWRDNVFPSPTEFRATWLDDDTLELDTGEFELMGRPHRVVMTYVLESEDVHRTTMLQGWNGEEPKVVAEGRFERLHADIRDLPNPLTALSDRLGEWVSETWETDSTGRKKRTLMVTEWALDEQLLRTRQYGLYEDGSRALELEENVGWDPIRGQFETLIQSTEGWVAYARYLDLGGGLRRLDCDVVFEDGRSLGVVDLFQTVEPGRVQWNSYFIQDSKKSAKPVWSTALIRREPADS